ncbi:hypothetical protein PQQ51_17050 [Paraburkholderia xenovorans]|uniref:hypothetical protein n=1 Tax=Paraburkholderia xenovorans TaxID=36873 RepID=UPI0038B9CD72
MTVFIIETHYFDMRCDKRSARRAARPLKQNNGRVGLLIPLRTAYDPRFERFRRA